MAIDLNSISVSMALGSVYTDSPDSDDSCEPEMYQNIKYFIDGRPAQGFNIYNRYLPYADSLESEAVNYFKQIKANLANSILLSVHKVDNFHEIQTYLSLYGQYFTLEDHILLIKTFFQSIQITGIEMPTLTSIFTILNTLLRKHRLISPKDLQIEWRPLYEIYCKYIFERKHLLGLGQSFGFEAALRTLIELSREYFPVSATAEILAELRPLQCPFTACKIFRCSFLLGLFLPTRMFPEDHEKGFKLWLDEMMAVWSGPNSIQYENIFFKLLARLAAHNIGYIDWSPFISTIFTKYTKSMNNSVAQSPFTLFAMSMDVPSLVKWIVSMIGGPKSNALQYIESLFKAIESNFHPSNMSRGNAQLTNILAKLSGSFIDRIDKERFAQKTWRPRTPKEYQITDAEIDKFVDILLPILYTAMFSRFGATSVLNSIRDLAWLRPEKVIPPLVEKLYLALDSNLEAHRLNSLLSAIITVVPVMMNGLGRYEEGKTHLVSLLFSTLPGLDCNDIKKCSNTFRLIAELVTSVPLLDCSPMVDIRTDLTDNEYNIALETVRFEEFVLIFLEKVLALAETYQSEHRPEKIDNDPVRQSSDESFFENSVVYSLSKVLSASSPPIFEKALDKLFTYLRGRLFEGRATIKLMGSLCGLFSKENPKLVLDKFLPYLHSTILGLTDNEDVFEEETVDAQLFLALQITLEIMVNGNTILQHRSQIVDILNRCMRLKPSQGYKATCNMLQYILETLTSVYPSERKNFPLSWEQLSDFENINPIRLWGKHDRLEDVTFEWHVPSDEEMNFAQTLLSDFLLPVLKSLDSWIAGEITLSREEIHRNLNIILCSMAGTYCVLAPIESEEYTFVNTPVPPLHERVFEIGTKWLRFPDGTNPRQLLATSARSILKHIIKHCDDDIKSLDVLIRIYQTVLGWDRGSRYMRMSRDYYSLIKKTYFNKLHARKRFPRRAVIARVKCQQETRIAQKTWGPFTVLHRDMVLDLFSLGLSHYGNVRAKAHAILLHFRHVFSYRLFAEELTKVFNKPRTGETEEMQGALTILLNYGSGAFMSVSDWQCITPLWLSIINTEYSEKPTIIALLEQITKSAAAKLQPIMIEFEIPKELVEIGKQFYSVGIVPDQPMPRDEEITKEALACKASNQLNHETYVSFVQSLVDSIESGRLHWRHLQFAFLLLHSLIRKDTKFPIEGVRIIVKNLINDHIAIRRLCINGVAMILMQNKPTVNFKFAPVNLQSEDPAELDWLYLKPDTDYLDPSVWRSTRWVNRTYISPRYCPPEGFKYYTEESALPARNLDSVDPDEAIILEFFLDKEKVNKLLDFITLDDKKVSSLGPRRFKIFQGLFRNFGITTLEVFRDFLEKMKTETKENVHRSGCDILTGLVRGSKYWPYQDVLVLRQFLEPVVKKLLRTISRETTEHYVEFCNSGFRRLDGRRFGWLFSFLIEDPLCSIDTTATSFQSFSHLKILSDLLISQCWRAVPYLRRLFNIIREQNHLKNSYQNIRQLVGCTLTQLLQFDNDFYDSSTKALKSVPRIDEILETTIPELEAASIRYTSRQQTSPSTEESSSSTPMVVDSDSNQIDEEEKETCNLLTTLCYWLHPHLSLNPFITRPQILGLVPIICEIKNRSKDDELKAAAMEALNSIGHCAVDVKYIDYALSVCRKMIESKSWHTRVSLVTFIQLLVSSNLFTLMNDPERRAKVSEMIHDLLKDDRIEVREKSAVLLGGLIHYQFIKVDVKLIKQFKVRCARKLTRSTQNNAYNSAELNEKHGGALGLCSIVSAYPYEVPEFLPDILMFLGDHLHDPQPIPTTIRKTLSDFKRTHYDNWRQHKEKFNEDQLAVITDLLVSPNYYA